MGCRLLAILFLALIAASSFAADRPWLEVHSPHFTVLTDTNEKQGREVALRFEQMRAVFGNLWHKTKVNLPVPLQIIAFRNREEMRRYSPLWKGKPVELVGFFQGSEDRNFILLDMSANNPYETIFHEYAHLLLHGNFPVLPVWFDEGFAEYFSSLKLVGKQVQYGAIPEHIQYTLSNIRWMPLIDLLSVQHNSAVYNERDKSGIFYAQSWLVVHYFMSNQKIADAAKYLQLTQIEKQPIPDAVKAAFGVDMPTFEKNIQDYFRGQGKLYGADVPSFEESPFISKRVDDATAQATLADVHAHSQDYRQQAVLEFQAVLEKDSGNVVANRGLGYLYLYENQFDKAATMFRRAALADPKDAQLYYLSALLMNREAMKEGKPPDNPLVMRQELEAAIALDPTMADAYNLLAFALSADGKLDAAIANQKKAIELNPSLEHYQSNLARLYLQAQKWDDAEAILSRLKLSSDPTVRDNASQNLAAMQANKEMAAEALRARELRRDDITAPQWRRKESASSTSTDNSDEEFKPDNRKVLYLYGRIQSVDCSADPVAVLTVKTSNKLMRLRAENYKKLLVMGADEFSCGWRDQKVLVNYKAGGKLDGDVVTVELQAGK